MIPTVRLSEPRWLVGGLFVWVMVLVDDLWRTVCGTPYAKAMGQA